MAHPQAKPEGQDGPSVEEPVYITRPNVSDVEDESELKIQGFKSLASYNWLDKAEPTILVPDTGTRYVDQNTSLYPWSPLEPLVLAVYDVHPDFDFGTIDIVTDRRPLRKLFGFVNHELDAFQFGVEVIGTTVVLIRMETKSLEIIPPGVLQGYRAAFEEACTKLSANAKGSSAHYRVSQYNLGALKIILRSACDAYLQDIEKRSDGNALGGEEKRRAEDLSSQMKATPLGLEVTSMAKEAPSVNVAHGGEEISHASLLEIKTRNKFAKRQWDIQTRMPDLWLAQTPNFVNAAHQSVGTKWSRAQHPGPYLAEFVEIDVRDIRKDLAGWEKANMHSIQRFLTVLKQLVDIARSKSHPLIVSYPQDGDRLEISKAETGEVPLLPEDVRKRWTAAMCEA